MNHGPAGSYTSDSYDYDMAAYPPHLVPPSPDSVLISPAWADVQFSEVTYPTDEYLHGTEPVPGLLGVHGGSSSSSSSNANSNGNFGGWPSHASTMLGHPGWATAADMSAGMTQDGWQVATSQGPSASAAGFAEQPDLAASVASATTEKGVHAEQPPASVPISSSSPTRHKATKAKAKSGARSPRSRANSNDKTKLSVTTTPASTPKSATMDRASGRHGSKHNVTLRTACRKAKPAPAIPEDEAYVLHSPDSTPSSPTELMDGSLAEERRARQNHNVVEKQYRNRLNVQFERLLAILPANQPDGSEGSSPRHGEFDDRRMSKAEVLELARRRIHTLEQERKQFHVERQALLKNVSDLKRLLQQMRQQGK